MGQRRTREVTVEVTYGVDLGQPLRLAASISWPERLVPSSVVWFCAPGGTYTRAYWDLQIPGHPGYSLAEYLVGRGHVVVTFDHLGTGESTKPDDGWRLTTETVARANAGLVEVVRAEELPSLPLGEACGRLPGIGVGHSMGAMLVIRQQGLVGTYDGLAVLGFTTLYPIQTFGFLDQSHLLGKTEADLVADLPALGDPYQLFDREQMRTLFYLDDVPPDVIAFDEAQATNGPGLAGPATTLPGIVATDAARIEVPLFLGFGQRDVSPDPRRDPCSYPRCGDITLHQLRGAGHCTNFASTRHQQWERLAVWGESVVAPAVQGG